MNNRPDPNAKRANPFEVLAEPDLSGFTPPPAQKPAVSREVIRAVSEQNNFPSRSPTPPPQKASAGKPRRRHRTGRNVQINIKAKQETIDRLIAIADKQGWVLGETLDQALHAFERSFNDA